MINPGWQAHDGGAGYARPDKFSVSRDGGNWHAFTPSNVRLTEPRSGKPRSFTSAESATAFVDAEFRLPGSPEPDNPVI